MEAERAAALKAAPIHTTKPKTSYVQWLKVWEWGKTQPEIASDPMLRKVETDAELPTFTALSVSDVAQTEQDPPS